MRVINLVAALQNATTPPPKSAIETASDAFVGFLHIKIVMLAFERSRKPYKVRFATLAKNLLERCPVTTWFRLLSYFVNKAGRVDSSCVHSLRRYSRDRTFP